MSCRAGGEPGIRRREHRARAVQRGYRGHCQPGRHVRGFGRQHILLHDRWRLHREQRIRLGGQCRQGHLEARSGSCEANPTTTPTASPTTQRREASIGGRTPSRGLNSGRYSRATSRTNVGTLTDIKFERGVSGRVYKVTIVGSARRVSVSGPLFKGVYNGQRLSVSRVEEHDVLARGRRLSSPAARRPSPVIGIVA